LSAFVSGCEDWREGGRVLEATRTVATLCEATVAYGHRILYQYVYEHDMYFNIVRLTDPRCSGHQGLGFVASVK
jgi:hypothetical protein